MSCNYVINHVQLMQNMKYESQLHRKPLMLSRLGEKSDFTSHCRAIALPISSLIYDSGIIISSFVRFNFLARTLNTLPMIIYLQVFISWLF